MAKEPKLMIRQLIQKVVLYDDKVEIYFKYTKKPDDNSRASLIFKGNYSIAFLRSDVLEFVVFWGVVGFFM